MQGRKRLLFIFYLNLIIVVFLLTYKIYLGFFEQDFREIHAAQVEAVQLRLDGRSTYSFAVVGNIYNSVGIFERKVIPMLNEADVDFVISAGNAVSGGGEDKYRAIYRTLSHLQMPYLLTFGKKEAEGFGSFRFYDHFGPYFFDFTAGGARYIFLDSTGETSFAWQLRWLEEELAIPGSEHRFIFIAHPPLRTRKHTLFESDDNYLPASDFRDRLLELIGNGRVDTVFSANQPLYAHIVRDDVDYIITGGVGGLIYNDDTSYYHFVRVNVTGDQVTITPEKLNIGQHQIFKTIESLWFFIHSLFYVGYLNFLLIISIFIIFAIKLYTIVFVGKDYYRNFDLDLEPFLNRQVRVAMFTNNYLPFIGGVPLSIYRLRQGLISLGNRVLIIAPSYPGTKRKEKDVQRVPTLFSFGKRDEFKLANIFVRRIYRRLSAFKPDVIHLHHPVWLGSLGLFLGRRLSIPTVYTYHTRLEHYAHFVPLPGRLFRNLISHALIKRFANKCDAVIVPTQSAEEYLRIIGVKSAIFVHPTGIDYAAIRQVDAETINNLERQFGIKNEIVCISVSRLSKEKNIEFMVNAMYDVAQRSDVPFKFLIVGEGSEHEYIKSRIEALNMEEKIILTGAVPPAELPAYYRMSDVFLFASQSETQGMVILEAMAAGLPVVALRSSGIDDLIEDDVNGYKITGGGSRWIEKTLGLMTDVELRQRLSGNASEFARKYDIKTFAENIAAVYAHVMAEKADSQSATVKQDDKQRSMS